jgi:hypothetical protein
VRPKFRVLPEMLAWQVDKAINECKRAGLTVNVKEAWLSNRPPVGSDLRVARVKVDSDNVEIVVVKAQTQPVGNVPPV